MRQLGSTELKRLHREWRRQSTGRVALILDRVTQPFNVGAIMRTAAAMRVDDVWLVADTPDTSNAKVGKTALGSEKYLTLHRIETTGVAACAAAHAAGFRTVGLELAEGAQALHALDLSGDICLVIGHEDRGLSANTLEACDMVGYIPQLGRIGSLNVATATSIAVYEARVQAWRAHHSGTS